MPRVGYSQRDREQVKKKLADAALSLASKQGVKSTTVEQICAAAGISRTFFYTFYACKEDLYVRAMYDQQPRVISLAEDIMKNDTMLLKDRLMSFLSACRNGAESGIFVMSAEEQQLIFSRLSPAGLECFRDRQRALFSRVMEVFGVKPYENRVNLLINLMMSALLIKKNFSRTVPLLVEQAADETVAFQLECVAEYILDCRRRDEKI